MNGRTINIFHVSTKGDSRRGGLEGGNQCSRDKSRLIIVIITLISRLETF